MLDSTSVQRQAEVVTSTVGEEMKQELTVKMIFFQNELHVFMGWMLWFVTEHNKFILEAEGW